jgi:preprotein translocase subunit SecD
VDRAPGPSIPSDAGYYVTADVVAQFDRLDCTGDVPAATGPQDQALVACARDGSAKYVLGPVELTGDHLAGVSASLQSQNWVDSMAFDGQGTIQLAQTTTRLASLPSPGNQLALLVDGRIETAPAVHEVIPEGKLLLSGSPTQDSAYALAASLGFGRGDNTWTLTSSGS